MVRDVVGRMRARLVGAPLREADEERLAKDPAARPTARAIADELAAFADAAGAPSAEELPRPATTDHTVRLQKG